MKKKKNNITIILAFLMLLTLLGLGCELPTIQEAPGASRSIGTSELEEVLSIDDFLASASEHKFVGYSIDDIRQFLKEGRQIYQELRVMSDIEGPVTYQVPVQESEIEYLMSMQDMLDDGDVQLPRSNPPPVSRIKWSGK